LIFQMNTILGVIILQLVRSEMSVFPHYAVQELSGTLKFLSIYSNSLSYINDTYLRLMTQCVNFFLQDNLLQQIPDVSQMTKLEFLQLQNNEISTLKSEYFNNLTSLKILDVSNNLITDICPILDFKHHISDLRMSGLLVDVISADFINNVKATHLRMDTGNYACVEKVRQTIKC